MYVLDKRNTLWLRDTVRQTSRGKSAAAGPTAGRGMSAWPYSVTTKYSYYVGTYHRQVYSPHMSQCYGKRFHVVMFSRNFSDIDECLSMPCQNGANCTDAVNGYNCSCTADFTGIHCETGKFILSGWKFSFTCELFFFLNSLHGKFFRGTMNMYLHFM